MDLVIFIGIPASGKSTFYKQHFFHSHVRMNLDMLKTRNREKQLLDFCFRTQYFILEDTCSPIHHLIATEMTTPREVPPLLIIKTPLGVIVFPFVLLTIILIVYLATTSSFSFLLTHPIRNTFLYLLFYMLITFVAIDYVQILIYADRLRISYPLFRGRHYDFTYQKIERINVLKSKSTVIQIFFLNKEGQSKMDYFYITAGGKSLRRMHDCLQQLNVEMDM